MFIAIPRTYIIHGLSICIAGNDITNSRVYCSICSVPICRSTTLLQVYKFNPTQIFLFFDNRQEFPKINMMATYMATTALFVRGKSFCTRSSTLCNGEHCLEINNYYNTSISFRRIFSIFVCVSGGGLLSGGLFAQGVNVRVVIVRGVIVRGVNVQVVNVRGVIVRGVNVLEPPSIYTNLQTTGGSKL